MKSLTILVPNGHHNLSSVVGTYEIFTKANAYYESQGRKSVFKIQLAGTSRSVRVYRDRFSVNTDVHIEDVRKTDLVIIPAVGADLRLIKQQKAVITWLNKMHHRGAEIASICTGAFLLASTGLLNNRSCSTHWQAHDDFKKMFPQVELKTDQFITDDNGLYTNGGAFSFLNLLIYLIGKYYDRATAIYCSKLFQIDPDRTTQSPFAIFTAQKKHNDELMREVQEQIEKKIRQKVSVTHLSNKYNMSRRNFDRRFIKATGNTPGEYVQRVKVEAAKKEFETSRKTVNEVMYGLGYNDPKAFRELFRKLTGLSPLDYRNKFSSSHALVR